MKETPISQRIRISFLGKQNAGKSSLINAISSQNLSIVSEIPGTTTDPVSKTMEILPLGPVILTDTAGMDDHSKLGSLRMEKTIDILNKTDIAVMVIASGDNDLSVEKELLKNIKSHKIPVIIASNKSDIAESNRKIIELAEKENIPLIPTSSIEKTGIKELKEALGKINFEEKENTLLDGIIERGDFVVLVTPIDESAPKGRLILPQTIAIRDALDKNAICICTQHTEYESTLRFLEKDPKIIITDSQVFEYIKNKTPAKVPITSFSILMARQKSDINKLIKNAEIIDQLKDGDYVLIAEACTHHQQKNDIGTVQIPEKLKKYTGKNLCFEKSTGNTFPKDLSKYALIIHCGACMLSRTQMLHRQTETENSNIPMTNYGIVLAKISGILSKVKYDFGKT